MKVGDHHDGGSDGGSKLVALALVAVVVGGLGLMFMTIGWAIVTAAAILGACWLLAQIAEPIVWRLDYERRKAQIEAQEGRRIVIIEGSVAEPWELPRAPYGLPGPRRELP